MASYSDLGPLNELTISQLDRYHGYHFLCSQQNGRVYASIDINDLRRIEEKMRGQIQNIENIKRMLSNREFHESPLMNKADNSQLQDVSSSSSLLSAFLYSSRDIEVAHLTTAESPTSSISDLVDALSVFASDNLSTNTTPTSLTTVSTGLNFPSEEEIKEILLLTTHITRSDTGTDGVYFLDGRHPDTNLLILKVYSESDRPMDEVIADRFFQCFGFVTPQYRAIHKDSPIGSLACKKLQELVLSRNQNQLNRQQQRRQQHLEKCMAEDSMITIMLRIPGKPFGELTYSNESELEAKVCNANVLRALGEMIFLDAVIGNVDRLKENDINLGNFFLLDQVSDSSDMKPIALLDHGYGLKYLVLLRKACKDVDLFLAKDAKVKLKKIMSYFFNALWENKLSDSNLEKLTQNSLDHLYTGIRIAADSLVTQFEDNEEAIQPIFEVLQEDERPHHIKQFHNMVVHVKQQKDDPGVEND
jgi:DNA-binding transcriptional MerR regulator